MKEPLIPCAVYIEEIPITPLGPIWIAMTDRGLASVEFIANRNDFLHLLANRGFFPFIDNTERTHPVVEQIQAYLSGQRTSFDLPIDWSVMRPFQQQVLRLTSAIPYGKTVTYGELASQMGNPKAARAVGHAQATNPMPLVIPCHRVIGSDGKLHGYGGRGGLQTKAWLLDLEKSQGIDPSSFVG